MTELIRLSQACLGQEESEAVLHVLNNKYLGMGEEVKHFEEELKAYISPEVSVACVNTGTSALQLAIQACGIGSGDHVIIPSITYVASFQAVSATGAIPIACDIDLETGFMDLEDVKKRITSQTKAIMPVHYAGGYGDLENLYKLAREFDLRVIEDAAHSFGGTYKGAPVGALGDIVCFSFDGIKNITCGEGGAVVSKDKDVIEKISDLRLLAVEKDTQKRFQGQRSWDFEVCEQGWRYHMSNINAAIGRAQLKKIDSFGEKRRAFTRLYKEALTGLPIEFLEINSDHVPPHIFVIKVLDKKRNDLKEYLSNYNIETGIHYKPNHLLSKFKGSHCPNAESFWECILSLPLHCNMIEQDILRVSEKIREFFKCI